MKQQTTSLCRNGRNNVHLAKKKRLYIAEETEYTAIEDLEMMKSTLKLTNEHKVHPLGMQSGMHTILIFLLHKSGEQ